MITMHTLEEHLAFLLAEDKACFEEGDWDRLDRIRLAIDDTREQIKKEDSINMNKLSVNQPRPNLVDVIVGEDNGWVAVAMSMGMLRVEVYDAKGDVLNAFKKEWPDEKKRFKVRASYSAMCETEVEAHNIDEAYEIAKKLDGGVFDTHCDPDDWHIEDVTEVTK